MLHLAQVKQKEPEGKVRLKLLAQQKAEYAWAVLPAEEAELVMTLELFPYSAGSLVLVELSSDRQIIQATDATHWITEIIDQYLSVGITPASLQEEMQRAEQWRQSLTLQSQELGRRALEMEARRDQIQELEEKLEEEKKQLEAMAAQLKENGNHHEPKLLEDNLENNLETHQRSANGNYHEADPTSDLTKESNNHD